MGMAMLQEAIDEKAPVTPGEILAGEFLSGYGLTQAALGRGLDVPPKRMSDIVNNRWRITADTALRLGLFFGTTPEFWQNLQTHYDLKIAREALSLETAEKITAQLVTLRPRPMYKDVSTQFPDWISVTSVEFGVAGSWMRRPPVSTIAAGFDTAIEEAHDGRGRRSGVGRRGASGVTR
jgi:addiction module HigA family antidote